MENFIARVVALAALALPLFFALCERAQAGEMEERQRIKALFTKNFAEGDFAALDAWYNKALKENTRMPAGDLSANRFLRSITFDPAPPAPGCTVVLPCGLVNEAYWLAQQDKAKAWQEQRPESTLAALVRAKAYVDTAWAYRGEDSASNVAAENMRKFTELNQLALRTLFDHAEWGSKDPNWWSQLLSYAPHGHVSQQDYEKLVQSAIAAFPKHPSTYLSMVQALTPQWGGSYEAMADLAELAVKNTKATEGQSMYASIYWRAYDPHLLAIRPDAFNHPDVDWPRIRAGFDDLIKRNADPFNLNSYAKLACIAARDKATTAKLLKRIGKNVVRPIWGDRSNFMRCTAWSQEGPK